MNRLFIFILILSPFIYSNTDKFCYTELFYNPDESSTQRISKHIEQQECKRDNIFQVTISYDTQQEGIPIKDELSEFALYWCRFDREILIEGSTLTCVLNSTKKRTWSP
tara:strand:+ start:213 stop:539 length:327 start_codon:yes stop_codon:yes gene_type:complete